MSATQQPGYTAPDTDHPPVSTASAFLFWLFCIAVGVVAALLVVAF